MTHKMADLGQPRKSSSKQTTTGKTNMTEERGDKDTKKENEKIIKGKARQNNDAKPVAVSLHDESVVNVSITNFTGNLLGVRGDNTGYHHAPRSQHADVLHHDESAVNIHITNFTGDMVGARGHNTGYHHGPRPQHASGLQHVNNRNTFNFNNINANTNNGDGNTTCAYGPALVRHHPQHHRLFDDSRSGDYSRRHGPDAIRHHPQRRRLLNDSRFRDYDRSHGHLSEYPGDYYRGRDRRSESPEDRHHGYRSRGFSQSHGYRRRDYRGPYNRY